MRRREVLAILPTVAIAGCSAPTPEGDGSGEPSTGTETTTESPTPTETPAFQVRDRRCTSREEGEATVSFESKSITVDGIIMGNDMCYTARLHSVSDDEELEKTVLTVETFRDADDDTACAQCLTAIEYTLTVPVEGSLPKHVTVYHKKGDYTRLMASTRR